MIKQKLKTELSFKYGLKEKEIEYIYTSYWKSIKNTIKKLPLTLDITEEDFNKLRVNFNIPYIGKLYSTYDKIIGLKKRLKYLEKIKNNKDDKNKEN